jgi:hypothetical protein
MSWTTGVQSPAGPTMGFFLFSTASRPVLEPTQPPIQWIPWLGREADHSAPFSAEVKNAWSYSPTPQYFFMAWYLVKHGDNFSFFISHNFMLHVPGQSSNGFSEIFPSEQSTVNSQFDRQTDTHLLHNTALRQLL